MSATLRTRPCKIYRIYGCRLSRASHQSPRSRPRISKGRTLHFSRKVEGHCILPPSAMKKNPILRVYSPLRSGCSKMMMECDCAPCNARSLRSDVAVGKAFKLPRPEPGSCILKPLLVELCSMSTSHTYKCASGDFCLWTSDAGAVRFPHNMFVAPTIPNLKALPSPLASSACTP